MAKITKKKFKLPISKMVGVPSKIELNVLEDTMQCPVCQKSKLKSDVHEGDKSIMFTKSLEYEVPDSDELAPSMYDDKGDYHQTNKNTYATEYSCSRGHRWTLYRQEGKERIEIKEGGK